MKISFRSTALSCLVLAMFAASVTVAPAQARTAVASKNKAKKLDHNLDAELHDAVAAFNVGQIRKLLARGADPNSDLKATDGTMMPVLQWITTRVSFGKKFDATKLQIVSAYVEAGVDVERKTSDGYTPLIFAAHAGNVPIIDCLRKAGANLEAKNSDGITALMAAASAGQSDAVRALIAAGANVNARTKANSTALMAAAGFLPETIKVFNTIEVEKSSHLEIVRMLVAAGADIDARAKDGVDAIAAADATGLLDVSAFLRSAKANAANTSSTQTKTPTTNPATANPQAPNIDSATALMLLAQQKPFDETKAALLLKSGADVNATDKHIQTALMYACSAASPDAVRFLLKNGANAHFVAVNGDIALNLAVLAGNSDAAFDVVQQLVAAGADASFKNHDGKSALDFARDKSNARVVDFLTKALAEKALAEKAGVQTPISTEDALKVDDNGYTTLMFAMSDTPFDAAKAAALVKAGVNVNAVDSNTESTLIQACVSASPDAVKFLLKNGAKVNYADKDGGTALMYSVMSDSSDEALSMVQQLIAAGADVNAKGKDGTTVLALARAKSNQRVVDALVEAGAK